MAQDSPARKPRHSPEQVERGLQAVAQAGGNTRTAAERLAQEGPTIPRSTLRNWLRQHPQLYKRLVRHARYADEHTNAQPRTPSPRLDIGRLPATQANGNRASVLDGARELIAQRLADLEGQRVQLEQHLSRITNPVGQARESG